MTEEEKEIIEHANIIIKEGLDTEDDIQLILEKLLNLIQRKNKQIDLMANTMAQAGVGRRAFTCDFGKECDQNGCRICIKKYFKEQAKEVKE